jgi:hypothetical protein
MTSRRLEGRNDQGGLTALGRRADAASKSTRDQGVFRALAASHHPPNEWPPVSLHTIELTVRTTSRGLSFAQPRLCLSPDGAPSTSSLCRKNDLMQPDAG